MKTRKMSKKGRTLRPNRMFRLFFAVILIAVMLLPSNNFAVFGNTGSFGASAVSVSKEALGDADGDGLITADDARFVLRVSVGLETSNEAQKKEGDIDGDGVLSALDARNILRISVGLPITDDETEYFCPELTEQDVPENAKIIYLTFDDGPSAYTADILNILDKYDVKATFFVIKNTSRPNVYKEIVEKGHSIALHSSSHKYGSIYCSVNAFFEDLDNISDYVYETAGVRTRLIRFPGGSSNTVSRTYCKGIMSELAKETEKRGYVYFDWNCANNDATGKTLNADQIRRAANAFTGKSPLVMLMHDAPGKSNTVKALPGIIENYQKAGYYFLPLNENSPTVHHGIAN